MTALPTALPTPLSPSTTRLRFLELEITGRCQLACLHCYADSGPSVGHGAMTRQDWLSVIEDAAALGVEHIQLIGGEPTAYPAWTDLVRHTLNQGMTIEVFSNLFHVRPEWWELFTRDGVTLATSYYSDQADQHDAITNRPGSYQRTRANIAEAVARGIPVRAGIIDIIDGQRSEQARDELHAIGVTSSRIDGMRGVGRGATATPDASQLCGRCGLGRAAIYPDGQVGMCVLSRFVTAGNVLAEPLAAILNGPVWKAMMALVPRHHSTGEQCTPETDGTICTPADPYKATRTECTPETDGTICTPADPHSAQRPMPTGYKQAAPASPA